MSGSRRWVIVLVAAIASLVAGGGAVAAAILLTGDDDNDRAIDVALGTAGLVNGTSKLLAELESPLVALNPGRRDRIVRQLEAGERKARRLIAGAREGIDGDESARRRLIEANMEITRVVNRVRRVARRPRGRLPGEAHRGRKRLEVVQVEVERLVKEIQGGGGGGRSPARTPARGRVSRSPVDLPYSNLALRGHSRGDLTGSSLAPAGDVNGDGRDDAILAAPGSGAAYVVFGGTDANELELGQLDPDQGFAITSLPVPQPYSSDENDIGALLGRIGSLKVAGVGDLNGDGLADVAVGAPDADPEGVEGAGSVYVVYGSREVQNVDADALPGRGFRVDGPGPFWRLGEGIAGRGDLNGDGRGDLVVGGRQHVGNEDITAAQGKAVAWALIGRERWPEVVSLPLRGAPQEGWMIKGIGSSLALAGDVNGDGIDDLVGGDAYNRMEAPGYAAIVAGRRTRSTTVDAERAGTGVAPLRVAQGRQIGSALAGVGDQNGDDLADVAVLSSDLEGGARVHVVFGRSRLRAVRLDRLGGAGAEIDLGRAEEDRAWSTNGVAAAGDVDGDRRQDLLVAAPPITSAPGRSSGGARMVLGGRLRPGARIRADRPGTGIIPVEGYGVRVSESGSEVYSAGGVGYALAGVGDMDGDGIDDVAVGAPRAETTLDRPDPAGGSVRAEGAVFISYRSPLPNARGPLEGLVSASGLGAVSVGTAVTRVEKLLRSVASVVNGTCGDIPTRDARIGFLTGRGSVARVDVTGPGYRTAAGIQVGDSEATVRAAYGARLRSSPHEYSPNGRYLSVRFEKGRAKLVFETDGQKVTSIRAGRTPEVNYVEGCA